MLSPKQAPPAIAPNVKVILPPTIWFNHKNTGAQAANVPQEVPVAMDRIAVTMAPTKATVFPVIPNFNAIIMIEAPTPVDMNASAIA